MKKAKFLIVSFALAAITTSVVIIAADHIDTPTVTGKSTDITDVYAFQGQDPNNIVLVANTQGLLSPAATAGAQFDPNTLLEFNIDNNNDNVEDLVIQANFSSGKMRFYGPAKPTVTGTRSQLEGNVTLEVPVTSYDAGSPSIATKNGMSVFAGPRDDPFFFDLDRFKKIIAGQETSFRNPGVDAFAGTNVLSVIVEVPKSVLGATNGKINLWFETKKKI
jgi:hypothetical protein